MENKDLYWEHPQHNTYQNNCSECHKENDTIKFKLANDRLTKQTMAFFSNLWRTQVRIDDNIKGDALRNKWGDNYPLGYQPE